MLLTWRNSSVAALAISLLVLPLTGIGVDTKSSNVRLDVMVVAHCQSDTPINRSVNEPRSIKSRLSAWACAMKSSFLTRTPSS